MNGEQPQLGMDNVMQQAKEAAFSHLDHTESISPENLADAKMAEISRKEAEETQRAEEEAQRVNAEREELERRATEMAPTEEELKAREAKRARMDEMNKWANTTGAVAEGKAKKSSRERSAT